MDLPLSWHGDLAAKAQNWANHLASIDSMQHSDSYNILPYSGENLAWGYGRGSGDCYNMEPEYNQHCAVLSWYNEYDDAWGCSGDWRNPSGVLGHFTAMIWKGK